MPALSVNLLVSISIVVSISRTVGVKFAVYVVPLPVKSEITPPLTVKSSCTKSETLSLNVNVNAI